MRLEARSRALQREERGQQRPRTGEQHERRADLRDGKQPKPPVRAGRDAHTAGSDADAARRIARGKARYEREQDGGGKRESDADPEHAGVDVEIERAHGEPRRVPCENRDHWLRDGDAKDRARAAEHEALGEQRPPKRPRRRPERRTNGKLTLAPDGARQDQVGDVRARDQEHQRRRGEQHEQNRPGRRHDLVAQLDCFDGALRLHRIRFLMVLDHPRVDGFELRARLLESRARRKAGEELRHPVHAPLDHRRRQVMRAGDDVRNDLRFGGIGNARLEHADDRRGPIPKAHDLADDRPIGSERRRPEAICQDDGASRFRAVVSGVDQTAEHRPQSHHGEIGPAHDPRAYDARLAEADHRERDLGEVAELRQGMDALAQVANLGHREVGVLDVEPRRGLTDIDEPVFVPVDERLQQHAPDDTEHGGVGADAERKGDDDRHRQALDPEERTKCETDVCDEVHKLSMTRRTGMRSIDTLDVRLEAGERIIPLSCNEIDVAASILETARIDRPHVFAALVGPVDDPSAQENVKVF